MALPYQTPNDPALIKGTKQATPQADSFLFVKGQGWTTVKSWEAPTLDAAFGKAEEMRLAGFNQIRVQQSEPGRWRVEGTIEGQGDGTNPDDTAEESWTFDGISEAVDIINHPRFQIMPNNDIRMVLDFIKNPGDEHNESELPSDLARELYRLLLRKISDYIYDVPVLKHTISPAPSDSSPVGAQMIWTLADINVNVPLTYNWAAHYYNNPPYDLNLAIESTWGWLKGSPRLVEDVSGRSRMEEEWTLALWPLNIYQLY